MMENVSNPSVIPEVEAHGFAIVPKVVDADQREALLSLLGPVSGAGRRGLLALPAVAQLARSQTLLDLVRLHLPAEPIAVRGIYFDKSAGTNWLVPWHQDLTLALRERGDASGFGPWSVKDGVPHVQPPIELLQQMLTVRLHLDDADASSGALHVLPGSHRHGRLSATEIHEWRARGKDHLCAVPEGGAMLMRPLLLHASGRSESARHRRVIHIEYAAFVLPAGLQWHEGG